MAHYYYFHDQTIGNRLFYETSAYQGLNLLQLEKIGRRYQLKLNSYRVNFSFIQLPCIFPTQIKGQNHYLIVLKKQRSWYLIGDPAKEDFQWCKKEVLQKYFQNVMVTILPIYNEDMKRKKWPVLKTKNWLLGKILLSGAFCTLVLASLNLMVQFGVKTLIEQSFFHVLKPNLSLFLGISLLFLGQTIIAILWKIQLSIWQLMHQKQQNKIFFAVLAKLDWTQFAKQNHSGIWRKYHDLQIINDYQISAGLTWIRGLYLITGSIIALMFFDFWITLPIVIVIILNALLNLIIWPKQQENMRKMYLKTQTTNQQMHHQLKQWEDWKGRRLWKEKNQQLFVNVVKNAHFSFKATWYQFLNQIIDQQIGFWSQIILIACLVWFRLEIKLTAAQILFILGLSASIFVESQILFAFWVERKKIQWLKRELTAFLTWNQRTIEDTEKKYQINGTKIEFKNLNFSYNAYDYLWKNNIDGVFDRHLWINGKNGIGKSTFLKLFLNPDLTYQGEIWLKQKEWRMLSRQKRNDLLYLTSHAQLLSGTIKNNILIYNKHPLTPNLVKWMTNILHHHNLDWNTNCCERKLSNGEKQIVVFLSLFAANQTIYLLDEVLNAVEQNVRRVLIAKFLDYKSQQQIIFYVSHDSIADLPMQKLTLN